MEGIIDSDLFRISDIFHKHTHTHARARKTARLIRLYIYIHIYIYIYIYICRFCRCCWCISTLLTSGVSDSICINNPVKSYVFTHTVRIFGRSLQPIATSIDRTNISENTQEMPHSRSTILPRYRRRRDEEQIRTKQTPHRKPQTHIQTRTATEESP